MIAITGATGTVGKALLSQLLDDGARRSARSSATRAGWARTGSACSSRSRDLGDPHALRHALRGADTVIHLAATIRDQPPRRVEEVNGLGTLRLLRAAERAGAERFVFFSALGATPIPAHALLPLQGARRAAACANPRSTPRSSRRRSSTTATTPG